MTRKERDSLAKDVGTDLLGKANSTFFAMGAQWADENPDERMIAKYLYEKKGYPIDLNGHLPSFEETMKDVEQYIKYKEKKLIDKYLEELCSKLYNQPKCQEFFKEKFIEGISDGVISYSEEEINNLVKDLKM